MSKQHVADPVVAGIDFSGLQSAADKICRTVDELRERLRKAVDIAEGICPECGAEELHSAAIDSDAAVSCTECNYVTTYKALRS